jgi:hypothetical protein
MLCVREFDDAAVEDECLDRNLGVSVPALKYVAQNQTALGMKHHT